MDRHKEAIDFYAKQFIKGYKERDKAKQFGMVGARELTEKLIAWLAADCPRKEEKDG
jgi:hypothetical protein